VKLCALTRTYGERERFARKLWLANCADSSFHNRVVHFHLGALLDGIVRDGHTYTVYLGFVTFITQPTSTVSPMLIVKPFF
jgi:hypothetical protein